MVRFPMSQREFSSSSQALMNSSYRDSGRQWAIVAGDNYGEGSSREAAALSPRYMGGFAVIARSMARIHETVSDECQHN
jgi:aconitase A